MHSQHARGLSGRSRVRAGTIRAASVIRRGGYERAVGRDDHPGQNMLEPRAHAAARQVLRHRPQRRPAHHVDDLSSCPEERTPLPRPSKEQQIQLLFPGQNGFRADTFSFYICFFFPSL